MWRSTFSSTTMASSTTSPVATIRAISERLLSEKPAQCMAANVPMSETGIATTGMSAVRSRPRKAATTATTSPTDSSSVKCASRSVARMPWERSTTTSSRALAGTRVRR
ncbi:hypothetical protein ACAN107058_21630 [Paracidovorax anthurii]